MSGAFTSRDSEATLPEAFLVKRASGEYEDLYARGYTHAIEATHAADLYKALHGIREAIIEADREDMTLLESLIEALDKITSHTLTALAHFDQEATA